MEYHMKTWNVIIGCILAIVSLVVSRIGAELAAGLVFMLGAPMFLCNILAGILYIFFAYLLVKLLSNKFIRTSMKEVSIPRVSIKGRWIVVAICFPLIVTGIYLILPGTFVSSGMDRENILNTVSAGVVFNSLAAGIVEEMVFRGIIRNLLAKRWNTAISIVLPSVLFAAVHLIGQSFNPVSSILVLIGGTLVGCMFSVIAIVFHAFSIYYMIRFHL